MYWASTVAVCLVRALLFPCWLFCFFYQGSGSGETASMFTTSGAFSQTGGCQENGRAKEVYSVRQLARPWRGAFIEWRTCGRARDLQHESRFKVSRPYGSPNEAQLLTEMGQIEPL